MSWLPKGERPTQDGVYWIDDGSSLPWDRVVGIEAGRVAHVQDEEIYALSDPRYDDCRFAPATPPPEWDLVKEIRNDPMENARSVDVNHQVSLDWIGGYEAGCAVCEEIARAYLAGEEKP